MLFRSIWNDDKEKKGNNNDKILAENNTTQHEIANDDIETKLENILSKINGVGKVDVMITYSSTSTVVPIYNEDQKQTSTQEGDNQGGTRQINETTLKKEVAYQESNGEKSVITQHTISPQIEGAIIIAEGASNSNIKTNIIQAVEAVTGIATYKIQVFEMN